MSSSRTDATPAQIEVWVCPNCGKFERYHMGQSYKFCRSTAACVTKTKTGTKATDMVPCAYIYLAQFDPDKPQLNQEDSR